MAAMGASPLKVAVLRQQTFLEPLILQIFGVNEIKSAGVCMKSTFRPSQPCLPSSYTFLSVRSFLFDTSTVLQK